MGFLLLVFSPSEKEKAEMEKGRGFNVEMPSPEDSEMEGNKVSAYEQEALAKKEKWRRGTFQEMSELLNKDGQDTAGLTAGKANMELPPEPEKGKAPGSIRSSAEAYRNMNRSLGTVYTRNENQPDADLLRRIEDLEKERKPAEEQAEGQTLEERWLCWKSPTSWLPATTGKSRMLPLRPMPQTAGKNGRLSGL